MSHNLTVDECLAMLRDGSLKPDSIAEEMECAGVTRPLPAQVEAARGALAALETAAVAQTAGLAGPDARALAGEIAALPRCWPWRWSTPPGGPRGRRCCGSWRPAATRRWPRRPS